jgi:ABC-2 type transport system ATP-binding protein
MHLSIRNLSKTYPNGVRALNDVTLTAGCGIFGLLGPNGAGKSTLMRILATLQEADSGTVFLDDLDVLREKDAVRRLLGYLPQEFGLYPKVAAWRLLDHFAELKGVTDWTERRALVDMLLHQTNLWEARNQRLGAFSGGMKQRFGIAQALIGDPKLVIVDEPTAGLDPEERSRFHNLLSEVGERIVVILSTHIVSDVSDLCPAMAILHHGSVVAAGAPAELAERLEGRIWQTTAARADVPRYLETLPVISMRLAAGRTVIRVFAPECPGPEFAPAAPDVEDVYFSTMRNPELAAC